MILKSLLKTTAQDLHFHPAFPCFLSPLILICSAILIWTEGTPFGVMTSRTAFNDCLLAEIFRVFLSCKVNGRTPMYSPPYHLIITISLVDRRDRHDTRGVAFDQEPGEELEAPPRYLETFLATTSINKYTFQLKRRVKY